MKAIRERFKLVNGVMKTMFDCPIEDDCMLVIECGNCNYEYITPRSKCKMRMGFKFVEDERTEYEFVGKCPNCHVRLNTTVSIKRK